MRAESSLFELCRVETDFDNVKFGKNSIDIEALREFSQREGKEIIYHKGDQLEREGDPARWIGFVTEGCFKYVTYGISADAENDYTETIVDSRLPGYIVVGLKKMF